MALGSVKRFLRVIALGLALGGIVFWWRMDRIGEERIDEVRSRVIPTLSRELEKRGFELGDAAFIRAFKESSELELWMQPDAGAPFRLFKTWPVAAWSGQLGPKLAEGDRQTPEGCYATTLNLLNPRSSFHLSFDIGYPNELDRAHGRTGSFIMIHGNSVSIGCLAMTDPVIEEIYLIVEAALKEGQPEVPVYCFPFRMTNQRLQEADLKKEEAGWLDFWNDLKLIHDAFESTRQPPKVLVQDLRYRLAP
jgi:murein L,D-transpeptidase YafK